MKKKLLFGLLGFALIFFVASCDKDDPNEGSANNSIQGKWVGSYHNGFGGPFNYLAITFKAGGALEVDANSNNTPDIANGTWTLGTDSVRATFTYVSGLVTGTYSIAGKYSSNSNVIVGTMGVGTSTSGAGLFSVTKE